MFFLFVRTGFITYSDHRKIWNTILAFTFLVTAVSGIILALKVTYKWQNSFFTDLLKWHVETGIAFSFTGLIHLALHLSYFFEIFKFGHKVILEQQERKTVSVRYYAINLFFIGYLSSSVQLLFLREMLNLSGGYELVAGTYLASWLICSASGSWFAGKSKINNLKKLNFFFGFSPILSIILMILFTRLYLDPGETPSFLVSLLFTLIVLFPFCFISGYIFMKVLLEAKSRSTFDSGKSFSVETIGGILAGLVVTTLTSGILNTYQILLITILLYFVYIINVFLSRSRKTILSTIITGTILILVFTGIDPDRYFRQMLMHTIRVESSKDTQFGNITRGKYHDEESLFYNHRLARWKNDEIEREENIHYAMLQHDHPEKVLLISGDPVSGIKELLKYPVKKIFYVEMDPQLVRSFLEEKVNDNEYLTIINSDAYRFVRRTHEKFDVVIMILPPPSTMMLNRYYTKEFFTQIKKRLNDGGVFACTPGLAENYYNYQSASLYSVIFGTLKNVFKNVIPVAGNKLFFISSDNKVSTEICSLVQKRGIINTYVSDAYLDDEIIGMKSEEILSVINSNDKINTLTNPVAYYHFQTYNLTKDLKKIIPALVIMFLFFVLPGFSVKPSNFPMYAAAAMLAGYEILTLIAIQSSAGNIYHLTGLVFAGVMGGLSAGAWIGPRIKVPRQRVIVMFLLLVFYFVAGLFFDNLILFENSTLSVILLIFFSLIPSYLTGALFKVLTLKQESGNNPSDVYSSDLAGSALGFVAVSAIIIPITGIAGTFIIMSILAATGIIFALLFNK